MSTYDIPCFTQASASTSNVPSTLAWASGTTSSASDVAGRWKCDPWFKTQVKAVAKEFPV